MQLTKLLPTDVLHVYDDTGRKGQVKGVTYPILEPQGSFGYFAQHQGYFFGWQTAIESATPSLVITQIAPDLYKLSVPDGGKVMIKTKISTIDFTTWWIWLILLGIILIILLLVWALRRPVHP